VTWWAGAAGLIVAGTFAAVLGRGRYRKPREPSWLTVWHWAGFVALVAIAWTALAPHGWWAGPPMALTAAAGAAAVIDLEVHRLPNPLLAMAGASIIAALTAAAAGTGEWARLWGALGGAGILFTVMLTLSTAGPLGGGDIKLAGLIGAALGCISWSTVLAGITVGFVLAGAGALAVRRSARSSHVPLGPALVAGATLAALAAL
jgi:leader peptidase (prepilin peptidase)/N-methyltransferase